MAAPRNDYNPNATIITTGGGGGLQRPRGLISAISEIQQYYVIEGQGQEIPAEFLTLEGSLDFFRIGATSGFKEGLFLILLFPVFSFYLLPFVFDTSDLFMTVVLEATPYFPIIINTLLCIYISRYYVGNLTRRAINSLFIGRSMLLVVKAGLIYVVYYMLFKLSTPERVWAVAGHFSNPKKVYYDYFEILPHMVPVATSCAVIIVMSAIVPYGAVYVIDHWRRYKIRKNQQMIGK